MHLGEVAPPSLLETIVTEAETETETEAERQRERAPRGKVVRPEETPGGVGEAEAVWVEVRESGK